VRDYRSNTKLIREMEREVRVEKQKLLDRAASHSPSGHRFVDLSVCSLVFPSPCLSLSLYPSSIFYLNLIGLFICLSVPVFFCLSLSDFNLSPELLS